MPKLHSYAVFCGSSAGFDAAFGRLAFELGQRIAQSGARLVYGGAQVGLMGRVADGALSAGGPVSGVLPGFLKRKEIEYGGLSELIIVDSMHERKLKMHELSDAVIALPGGWGTLEELTEMLTWAQLGLHSKPIGILNAAGFYDGLLHQIQTMVAQGFLRSEYAELLVVQSSIDALLQVLASYVAPARPKWLSEERS
jgi:uncharacterized protein (TIGR00730 family)